MPGQARLSLVRSSPLVWGDFRFRMRSRWSALGPHGVGNRWSSAGTSGQRQRITIAGQRPFTVSTSDSEAARRWVRLPPPPPQRAAVSASLTGDGGDAVVGGETGDQTGQESRSTGQRAAGSVTAMDITIQAHSNTPFVERGRPSNGRSEQEANAEEEAMPKR
jgi:hypothetical protein